MVLDLGFSLTNSGGWYALLTAILSAVFQLLPIRLYREPA
jgi:hypothetical protein